MQPSREEFKALASEHTVVPVWTEVLADLETPVAAFAKLVGSGSGFLLESVEHGERWSRYSFVGRDPVADARTARWSHHHLRQVPSVGATRSRHARRSRRTASVYRAPIFADLPPLQSGVMGFLGYDVVREVERLPDVPPTTDNCPTRR